MEKSGNPRERIVQRVNDMREYSRIAGAARIARRYFAMNAFDGTLTTLGMVMGSFVAGVRNAGVVIRTGIATSIAMGISGLWGAYLTEAAERRRELVELEKVTLADLGETKIGRASRVAVITVALVDGLAPFLAALLVLIPFFLAPLFGNIVVGYVLSVAIALVSLFGLGIFLGHISESNLLSYGFRTLVAGVVAIVLSLLLDGLEP
jgi:predicted membrane protein (TIGR00267 family)